ncbi:hypothetical protein DFQ26_005764 [Actinomortierella ambigua]|nr:hypothetical protein DFQ26_005764 [Actinomortierella ambigua]
MTDISIDELLFGADADDTSLPSTVVDPLVLGADVDSLLFDLPTDEALLDLPMTPFESFNILPTLLSATSSEKNTEGLDADPYVKVGENLFTTSTSDFPESFQLMDDLPVAMQDMLESGEVQNDEVYQQLVSSAYINPSLLQTSHQPADFCQQTRSHSRSNSICSESSLESDSSHLSSVAEFLEQEEQQQQQQSIGRVVFLPPFASATPTDPFNFTAWNSVHPLASGVPLNLSHSNSNLHSLTATNMHHPLFSGFSTNGIAVTTNPTLPLFPANLLDDPQQLLSSGSLPSSSPSSSFPSSVSQLDPNTGSLSTSDFDQLLLSTSSSSSSSSPSSSSTWLINAARYATSMGYPPMKLATASKHRRPSWLPGHNSSTKKASHRSFKRHSQPSLMLSSLICPPSSTSVTSSSSSSKSSSPAFNNVDHQRQKQSAASASAMVGVIIPKKARSVIRHRRVEGQYACPQKGCPYRYNLVREYTRHLQTHTFATTDRYRCLHCQAGLCRLDSVKRHMVAKGKQDCLVSGKFGEYNDRGELVQVRDCKKSWYDSAAKLRALEDKKRRKMKKAIEY